LASGAQSFAGPFIKQEKQLRMKRTSNDKMIALTVVPFSFAAPTARRVLLAGDFNDWDPEDMPMYKSSNGVWYLSVSLTPGRHEYRFIADGVWQDDPASQRKVANAMGSENCVKSVSARIDGGSTQQGPTVAHEITL
jgi:1,4-alpha-glucan branching enzyme